MIDEHFHLRSPVELSADAVARVSAGATRWRGEIATALGARPEHFPEDAAVTITEPALSPDRRVLTVTMSGHRGAWFVKTFAGAFPAHLHRGLPLALRLDLQLGRSRGAVPMRTWHPLYSPAERRGIDRVRGIWSDADLESLELHFDLVNDRPPLTAVIEADGWTACPYCEARFSTNRESLMAGNRHRRCGQRLVLSHSAFWT